MKTSRKSEIWWNERFDNGSDAGVELHIVGPHRLHFGSKQIGRRAVPVVLFPGVEAKEFSTEGFVVEKVKGRIGKNDPEGTYTSISCKDSELTPVFFKFVDQVFELLEEGVPLQESIDSSVAAWVKFILSRPASVLDTPGILGLWGELNVLDSFLRSGSNYDKVIASWVGPKAKDWDYVLPVEGGLKVEVKTSAGSEFKISVNNPKQLSVSQGYAWLTYLRVLEATESEGGLSLPQMTEEVLKKLPSGIRGTNSQAEFFSKLADAGYSPLHEDYYAKFRYKLREQNWYKVGSDFPILKETDLPQALRARLSEFKYQLSLAGMPVESDPCIQF